MYTILDYIILYHTKLYVHIIIIPKLRTQLSSRCKLHGQQKDATSTIGKEEQHHVDEKTADVQSDDDIRSTISSVLWSARSDSTVVSGRYGDRVRLERGRLSPSIFLALSSSLESVPLPPPSLPPSRSTVHPRNQSAFTLSPA